MISARDIGFAYNGTPVLHGVTLTGLVRGLPVATIVVLHDLNLAALLPRTRPARPRHDRRRRPY